MRIEIDIGQVERGLDAIERRVRALGSVFKELKAPLRLDQRDHAKRREGPDSGWAPRSQATLDRQRAGRRRLRRPMGRLPTAVAYTATGTAVEARSRALWSGIHQEGGVAGKGSRIPARPFLWVSESMLELARAKILETLLAAFGGR